MADTLSAKARELLGRPVLASLATLNPDGSPQITPLWVDLDGDDVVFNTARGRIKARNLERITGWQCPSLIPTTNTTSWHFGELSST
jgi:hypothetical protein